jgi:hypothetical protein
MKEKQKVICGGQPYFYSGKKENQVKPVLQIPSSKRDFVGFRIVFKDENV